MVILLSAPKNTFITNNCVVLVKVTVRAVLNVPGTYFADAIIADLCLNLVLIAALMPQFQIWNMLWPTGR